ncbi:CBN-SRA-9 protein [Caenorhabditis brenneri]|uniref:CBN-SRA-9 protein n=1 Tax=Caenorhabditis brenneri TaxID=135651 RepID=G0N3W7_CAEBE|nr:CBN-SRA-9 protein [Caenorhabditis brenneri]
MSTNNLTCASSHELARLESSNFVISQIVDLIAGIITFTFTYPAVQLTLKKSIFQWSTKILILQNLIYAIIFQLSYGLEACILLYKHFFMRGEVCGILQTEEHCAPYTKLILCTISGMIYGQTGLMMERACATFIRNYKAKKAIRIGSLISFLVLFCSLITPKLLLWDDPMDSALLGCFMLPRASNARSTVYFGLCTFLTLFNLTVSLSLKRYNKKLEYSTRFKVGVRFRKREAIDSTGTVCFLSLSLFILMFIYSVGVCVLRDLRPYITITDFYFWVVWFYTVPFFAMLLPILLIYRIRRTRSNRVHLLIGMSHEKYSQESHIKQMQDMWS